MTVKKKNRKSNKGDEYIEWMPKLKKWINECQCCKKTGYDPSMPEKIFPWEVSMAADFVREYFEPLELNEDGLCEVCAKLIKK